MMHVLLQRFTRIKNKHFNVATASYREHFLLLMKISFLPPTLPWSRPTPPALDPFERRETEEIKGIRDNPSLFRKRRKTISNFFLNVSTTLFLGSIILSRLAKYHHIENL